MLSILVEVEEAEYINVYIKHISIMCKLSHWLEIIYIVIYQYLDPDGMLYSWFVLVGNHSIVQYAATEYVSIKIRPSK